jgi:transcriptional regulator GlxA family with amidase domain
MLRSVAVIALPDVAVFELGVLCELFGYDRTAEGLPAYEFAVCSADGAPVRTHAGFSISPAHDLGPADRADLVAVVPSNTELDPPEAVLDVLRRAHARGAWVMSVCTGAFALGAAGLLDGRRCTTHWRHSDALQVRFPAAKVDPDVLYVADGNVITSAGTAAAVDCGLHLIREEQGSAVATQLARRMVVPPHRDGGQAQYIARPVPVCESEALAPLLAWISSHLGDDLDVETLARQMHMSGRTFARRFKEETGTTPYSWILGERVRAAQELLEQTDHSIDWVASEVGFGNAATLRHHFGRARGVSPQEYRRTFRMTA